MSTIKNLTPERLIERTLEFLHEMKQLDKLIELRGYQFVIEMNSGEA
jgi:hypothetical protein